MWRRAAASFMKALRQLGFLRLGFRANDASEEDGRVLALFRNRAELKKAYSELQNEIYRLKDRIKQQEGATQRVQEMLAALETRLGDPETAYPALVFYQLRSLWRTGRELIERFVAELARQQEERERRLHLAEFNRRMFARRQSVHGRLRAAETRLNEERQRLAGLEAERARLTRFWHYFRRRRLDQLIESARAAVAAAETGLTEARAAAEELEKEQPPPFRGLSVEARRTINLAAIAYAEVLCLRLVKTPLVSLAREATGRREVCDDYGSRQQCEALMAQIARARAILLDRTNITQEVKARAERLKQIARYRDPSDTTPTAESIAFSEADVLNGQAVGAATVRMPNVLAEDTWDLFRVLLR